MGTRLVLCAVLAAATAPGAEPVAPPLKAAFDGKFLVGTILDWPALLGRAPLDVALASAQFNAFTPANSLKPDATQRVEGRFTLEQGERLVELANACGATPVGHVLVWHSQTPAWFFQGPDGQPAGRELALTRLRTHIATVVGHFKGRIKQWDVVNEALSDAPGEYLRPSPWLKAIGEDYLAEAFRAAHAADPDALLIYNDYNIELGYKRPKALRLLKSLLDQGVPVHAVGVQCHWRLGGVKLAEVEESLRQYGALGLKVMITELDVGVLPSRYRGADVNVREGMTNELRAALDPYVTGLPDDVAQRQADFYRQAFEMFLRHREFIGRVTFWGSHDGDSWLNNFPIRGRTDYPLLFDRQRRPKPACEAVRQAAAGVAPVGEPRPARFGGTVSFGADDAQAFPEPPPGLDADRADVPHGRVETIDYDSKHVGQRRQLRLYTPPGYSAEKRYPVLYLLHGIGGDETEWERFAKPHLVLDNLLAAGLAVPMIIALPNGRSQVDDRAHGNVYASAPAFAAFEQDLLDDLIPALDQRYATLADREHRALAGLSMGGGQSLNFGLAHLDRFAWVGGFSSAPNTKAPAALVPDPAAARASLKLLWLSCGRADGLFSISQGVHRYLREQEVPHVWNVDGHGHDATEWRNNLYYFLQRVFR